MFEITDYGHMIEDRGRFTAYREALKKHVTPASVVVDIGTGTGIFALLACKFGARRVFAIEPANVIEIARTAARVNGFADRITFIHSRSLGAELDEKADIVISDLRDVLPLHRDHLLTIKDARNRFLKPDGLLLPKSDTLWLAPIEAPEWYQSITSPWHKSYEDLDLSTPISFVTNTWHKYRFESDQLLSAPTVWADIDYSEVEHQNFINTISWTPERTGTIHGLGLWFESNIDDQTTLSNAPQHPPTIYGRAIFPLSCPVDLSKSSKIRCCLRADYLDSNYTWSWNTVVEDDGITRASYKQSSFLSVPHNPVQLKKRNKHYVPTLNQRGRITVRVLDLMQSNLSIAEITSRLKYEFTDEFKTTDQALTYINDISVLWSD